MVLFSVYSQENPKIDKKVLFSRTGKTKEVQECLKDGEHYYKNRLYDASLSQYLKLYSYWDSHSPLNYKIGVSCLNGSRPEDAMNYFLNANVDVAKDYRFQLGRAYLFNHKYDEAKEEFIMYYQSLKPRQQKKMKGTIDQWKEVCDFSEKAYRDSVPVFIINMGPNVNSYYDDYSPVEYYFNNNPHLYFTSRRPKYDISKPTNQDKFKERVFYSVINDNLKFGEGFPAQINSKRYHTALSGVDNKEGLLFYYNGQKGAGDIYGVSFRSTGKVDTKYRLKKKFNKGGAQETSITFTDEGDFYYVSDRKRGGAQGGKDIWYAQKKQDKKNAYYKPVNLGDQINTPLDEEGVFVTGDGNTLWFSSNGHPGMGGFDVFVVEKDPYGQWGKPVNLGYPINSPNDDIFYRVSSDPNIAYFSSKRQGSFGGLDLYIAKKDLRIPFILFGKIRDIASQENLEGTVTLFDVDTDMPVGTSTYDLEEEIYTLSMEDGGNLYVQVESPGYRTLIEPFACPQVRHEKVERDFELERLARPFTLKGYVSDTKTGKALQAEIVMKPEGEESPFYRTVSDVSTGYYSLTVPDKVNMDFRASARNYHSREEMMALDDFPGSELEKNVSLQRSLIEYILSGKISEEGTGAPVKGTLNAYIRGEDDKIVSSARSDEATGLYELVLLSAGPFNIEISAENYFFANEIIFFEDTTDLTRNFELKRMKIGAAIVMENILFHTGSANLKPESYTELNKMVALLKENPRVRVELSGHTDNTGSIATNKKLSKARAMSVMNYFLSQGITADRMEYEGYGPDIPIAPNTTVEGRAANRRVEMKIID